MPKPLQNGSLQNFKNQKISGNFENFLFFRLLANVVKRKGFEEKSRSLTENINYFEKTYIFRLLANVVNTKGFEAKPPRQALGLTQT